MGIAPAAQDWNVVVTLHPGGYRDGRKLLARLGAAWRSGYYNLLLLRVEDLDAFLVRLEKMVAEEPGLLNLISRVAPAQHAFDFATPADFAEAARAIAHRWTEALAGCSFHARLHRHGLKHEISTPLEERALDDAVLAATAAVGNTARIQFDDPDAVLDAQIVDHRAGLSLWTRDDLRRYPFLRPD